MSDLVFEKIVSLNGIARVIPLFVGKSVNIDGQDDDLARSDDISPDDRSTDEIMISSNFVLAAIGHYTLSFNLNIPTRSGPGSS
jgi:hypothetical protein